MPKRKNGAEYQRWWREKNKEKVRLYHQKYSKEHRIQDILYRRSQRMEIIRQYGGACACCGESNAKFLALDHVNNDGCRERRAAKKLNDAGTWLRKLRSEGFPRDRYQLLCHNCNNAKAFWGVCPHESARRICAG